MTYICWAGRKTLLADCEWMCSASGPECDTAEQEGLKVPWLLPDSAALSVGAEPSLSPLQLLSRYHR